MVKFSTLVAKRSLARRREERGVVLFVALIVLVVMTLAGITLLRQMTSGVSIAGNIAFKETATSIADRGSERAIEWIQAQTNTSVFWTDDPTVGYLSYWNPTTVDPASFDWVNKSVQLTANPDDAYGNITNYILERLCLTAGLATNDPAQICSDGVAANPGTTHTQPTTPGPPPTPLVSPYFRVTTKVMGPRNTVTYTQVLLH